MTEQIELDAGPWAVVPKLPLSDEEVASMGQVLRAQFPELRFIVFAEPVDLVSLSSLDAAWKAVEAALPEGTLLVSRWEPGVYRAVWSADGGTPRDSADSDSPTAALQALAAQYAATRLQDSTR